MVLLRKRRITLSRLDTCHTTARPRRTFWWRVLIRQGGEAVPTAADRAAVLGDDVMLLPAVVSGSGPFPDQAMGWTRSPANDGQRIAALSWYLALMTDTCLDLIGSVGPTVIEGPFARNSDYLAMLSALRPAGVHVADSATGTSAGAAMLFDMERRGVYTRAVAPDADAPHLRRYAAGWRGLVAGRGV